MHKIPLKQYWTLLRSYLKPQWPRASLLAVLLLARIGLQLVNPQIMRFFIDTAMAGGALRTLLNAGVLFLGVALANQALSVATTYLGQDVAWAATNALRLDLTLHCLKLDQSFHKAHTPGELLERIDGDVNSLANFFSRMFVELVGSAALMVGILTLLFLEDWRVGLGISLFALIALAVMVRIRAIAIPYWHLNRQLTAEFYGFLAEQLEGTEDIRANGAGSYVMLRFYEITRKLFPPHMRSGLAGYGMWMSTVTIFALGNAVAFALSAYLWQTGEVTIGTIYLIFHYTELLRGPISGIRAQLTDLQQAEAGIGRVQALFDTASKLQDGNRGSLPEGALSVDLDGVSFGYDEDLVLRDVTVSLAPGRVLGLLGRTGSGKTTLARLLVRLYDPTSGSIELGGLSPRDTQVEDVRQRVGMVTQEVQLLKATVRDNLTFYDPDVTDEQLEAVLEDLGLANWLAALPRGLDTELDAGSGGLSAGQAQLLAFARAFLADPGLVILDEASSRLDPATEQLIERAIDRLLAGRTGIVIAHRLATVHRVDEILILEDGQVLEHGERAALAGDPDSHFYRLLQTGLQEVLA